MKGIWDKRGSGLFAFDRSNLLLRVLLETPHVIEVEVDSRRQLDGQLKQTCETFIAESVNRLAGEIPSFLEKVRVVCFAVLYVISVNMCCQLG